MIRHRLQYALRTGLRRRSLHREFRDHPKGLVDACVCSNTLREASKGMWSTVPGKLLSLGHCESGCTPDASLTRMEVRTVIELRLGLRSTCAHFGRFFFDRVHDLRASFAATLIRLVESPMSCADLWFFCFKAWISLCSSHALMVYQ